MSGVDEDTIHADTVPALVAALARAKAEAVATRRASADGPGSEQVVIGCDSLLELDGIGFGKPADAADAVRRWQLMRGR